MQAIRLFIGGIRPLPESGRPTGMYKQPAGAPVVLGSEGFAGDEQADRRVHGGPEKAVHLYPADHYARLAARFPEAAAQLVPGSLGENLSLAGINEDDVRLGEVWALGDARLQICQPRNPCWKIDERFASEGMAAFIAEQQLTGWYFRVLAPGEVAPDAVPEVVERPADALTLGAAMRLWHNHRPPIDELAALSTAAGIASSWKAKIDQRLAWLRANQNPPPPPAFHVKPQ